VLARKRRHYEQLNKVQDRDWEANLSMAECALTLLEQGIFHFRQTEHVRALLRKVPAEARDDRYQDLEHRLKRLLAESSAAKSKLPPISC
jgi:thioredoxin-like negative regulator of GroEL